MESETENNCVICFENNDSESVAMYCGHKVHQDCWERQMESGYDSDYCAHCNLTATEYLALNRRRNTNINTQQSQSTQTNINNNIESKTEEKKQQIQETKEQKTETQDTVINDIQRDLMDTDADINNNVNSNRRRRRSRNVKVRIIFANKELTKNKKVCHIASLHTSFSLDTNLI